MTKGPTKKMQPLPSRSPWPAVTGAARKRAAPEPSSPKPPLPPPKGKYSELWQKLFTSAEETGHVDPERFADSALRARERGQQLTANKHKLQRTDKVPARGETCETKPPPVKAKGPQCKARTFENRQCPFAASCGHFCKKHSLVK
jgi:hypothetical protein